MKFFVATALVLCVLAGVRAEDEEVEARAHVVVLKTIHPFPVVEGTEFNVTYNIHNLGSLTAMNIEIADEWPEDQFDLVSDDPEKDVGAEDGEWAGAVTVNVEKMEPGANVTHIFTLTPSGAGEFLAKHADVEYSWMELNDETNEEEIVTTEAKSSMLGRFPISSASDHLKSTSYYEKEWLIFGSVTFISTVLPFLLWNNKANTYAASARKSR